MEGCGMSGVGGGEGRSGGRDAFTGSKETMPHMARARLELLSIGKRCFRSVHFGHRSLHKLQLITFKVEVQTVRTKLLVMPPPLALIGFANALEAIDSSCPCIRAGKSSDRCKVRFESMTPAFEIIFKRLG